MVISGYPRVYLGRVADALKQRLSFPTVYLTKDTYRDVIAHYSTIKSLPHPLVLEDISFLTFAQQATLLKFVEESPLKIVLLASEDNILPTIFSRMVSVYKVRDEITSKMMTYTEYKHDEDSPAPDRDIDFLTSIKKLRDSCPIEYYYNQVFTFSTLKQKIAAILEHKP